MIAAPVYRLDAAASKRRENGIRPEIETFDLSHIHGARRLIDKGLMDAPPHVQFVMGVLNAMPADERLLDILLNETCRILPQATWTAKTGRSQPFIVWSAGASSTFANGFGSSIGGHRQADVEPRSARSRLELRAVTGTDRPYCDPCNALSELAANFSSLIAKASDERAELGRSKRPYSANELRRTLFAPEILSQAPMNQRCDGPHPVPRRVGENSV